MNTFNFSDYDEEDNSAVVKAPTKPKKNTSFDFDEYEIPETQEDRMQKSLSNDKFYQSVKTPDYSPEEIRGMPFYEKMKYAEGLQREQDYLLDRGFTKGFASKITLGQSEKYEAGELYGEPGEMVGQLVGDVAPIAIASTIIGIPLVVAGKLLRFGAPALAATRVLGSALTGGGLETARQAVKGEGFDSLAIAEQGVEFGVVHGLFEAVPAAFKWLKSLNPGQQSELLVNGSIPKDLTPNKYKVYEKEVVPRLQEVAKQESEIAYAKAVEENNTIFENKMSNTQADHERKLAEISKNKQSSQEDFARAQQEYEKNVQEATRQHQESVSQIEQENQSAQVEQQQNQAQYDQLKNRQSMVNEAIQPSEGGEILQGKVSAEGKDVGIRPIAPFEALRPIEIRIGDVVSTNSVADTAPNGRGNTTTAGRTQTQAVRANDAVDYKLVQDAYTLSDELNSKINAEQPNMVSDLMAQRNRLTRISKLSPVQDQQLSVIDALLNDLTITSQEGEIIGLKPINNNTLQEQGKSLRYFMDFNFQHGNSRGILTPTLNTIEDGIVFGSTMANDKPALDAHKNAKKMYGTWAKEYDNSYIRPYRDVENQSFIQNFESSLNIDNFNPLNVVLDKSNAGQQVSGVTKRALVDKYLSPFYADPKKINTNSFNEKIRELGAVLTPEQESLIRTEFNISKKAAPTIKATKIESPVPPKDAKIRPIPEKPKISEFKKKPKEVKDLTVVKVPTKSKVQESDAMRKAAYKLNITNEQAIKQSDTITGFRELKTDLLKTKGGDKISKTLDNLKTREILYEGNVKREFKGNELKSILNKGDNYEFISEIHGEEVAKNWLETAEKIADQKVTADRWKRVGGSITSLKVAHVFGIL